jgi:hypothetical protein
VLVDGAAGRGVGCVAAASVAGRVLVPGVVAVVGDAVGATESGIVDGVAASDVGPMTTALPTPLAGGCRSEPACTKPKTTRTRPMPATPADAARAPTVLVMRTG